MKMKSVFLFVLYYGLTCFRGVCTEQQPQVKRGDYPYMVFIYFADHSVKDSAGQRFMRSGVIIRSDWILTAAVGEAFINAENGFPRKTLLARAGAVSVDSNFTINEDEGEQEREIIEIVRPMNLSATQWWTTDISLMKTLFPFKETAAVGVKTLDIKRDLTEKSCSILAFTQSENSAPLSDEKHLTLLHVELLPSSIESCGSHFTGSAMICAKDSGDDNDRHEQFCHGNSGGPLICNRDVVGLQTYINNNCKQPHLYQLLSAWDSFITCGIEDKCTEEHCANICDVTHKDPPPTTLNDQSSTTENVPTTAPTILTSPSIVLNRTDLKVLERTLSEETPTVTVAAATETTSSINVETTETSKTTEDPSLSTKINNVTESITNKTDLAPMRRAEPNVMKLTTAKPKGKGKGKWRGKGKKSLRQDAADAPKTNASSRNMYIVDTLFFGFLVLVCL